MYSINKILEELKERKAFLEKGLKEVNKSMAGLPEGKLRTIRQRNLFRYYEVIDPTDRVGKYIHVANIGKAKKLAQKDYYEKLKKQMSAELDLLNRTQLSYEKGMLANKGMPYTAESVYANLSEVRKILVSPLAVSDEEYANIWQNTNYNGNIFREEEKIYSTKKEELVRSKS